MARIIVACIFLFLSLVPACSKVVASGHLYSYPTYVLMFNIILFTLNYIVDLIFIRCFAKASWKQCAKIAVSVAITSHILQILGVIVVPPVMFVICKILEHIDFLKSLASPLFLASVPLIILAVSTNLGSVIVSSKLKLEFKKVCLWVLLAQGTLMAIFAGIVLLIKQGY